jgi:hypothetical protein
MSDFEEESVENKTKEEAQWVQQPLEAKQLVTFSFKTVERGSFNVEVNSLNVLIVIPTKSCSKYMMRCRGKEQVEEGNSLAKVIQKWVLVEAKEIHKMLQWIWMGSKERQWAERASVGGLFTIHWIVP